MDNSNSDGLDQADPRRDQDAQDQQVEATPSAGVQQPSTGWSANIPPRPSLPTDTGATQPLSPASEPDASTSPAVPTGPADTQPTVPFSRAAADSVATPADTQPTVPYPPTSASDGSPSAATPAPAQPVAPYSAPVAPSYSAPVAPYGAGAPASGAGAPQTAAQFSSASGAQAPRFPGQPAQAPQGPQGQAPQGASFSASGAALPAGWSVPGQTDQATRASGKKSNAGRMTALVLAAALVGGGLGFGGAWAGGAFRGDDAAVSSGSSGSTITVNNPDSVTEATAVAASALPSVVTIQVSSGDTAGSGSGVVLSADGYVVTNTHVVTLGGAVSDPTIKVTSSDGTIYDATVVGTDPTYDLAVIKLTGASGLTPIDFGDSSSLDVGSTTVAIGAPLGLENTVTTGIVSALDRSIEIASSAAPEGDTSTDSGDGSDDGQGDDGSGDSSPWYFDIPGQEEQQTTTTETISISVIQTDAAINPGNSGGALLDAEGKLIGINVAIATADSSSEESGSIGVGFAIPSNVVDRIANEIIDTGSATHGLLGASVQDSSNVEGVTHTGAYIEEVTDGGAAAAAGLQKGDIVTSFNGESVASATDLTARVRALAAGSDAKLTYVRDGSEEEAEVTLGTLS